MAGAVRVDGNEPPGAMTIKQLQASTGFGECRVRGLIGQLRAAGRVKTIFVWREGIDGHMHQLPLYQLVEGK